MAKTSLERFLSICYITEVMAAICGANVMNPKFRINILTWTVIIMINIYYVCTIYTIYIGFVVFDDWKVMLQTLCWLGGAVQGYCKLLCAVTNPKALVILKKTLVAIYTEYQSDEEFLPVLIQRTQLTTKYLKMVMCIYIALCMGTVVYPVVYSLAFSEKLLIMHFYLPGLDHRTDMGYYIHNTVHGFLIMLGAFGSFAGDMYIFLFVTHVPLFKDILRIKCKKFSRMALNKKDPSVTMPLLKDIASWHQDYNKYVEDIDNSYYYVILVQTMAAVVSISCTLFSIVIRSWPSGPVYLIYSFIILYAYCGLGNLVELSNDEVTDIFYSDCLWYEVSVPEQKLVLLMIRKSQAAITLTVGKVMPLSMSTALQLTKAIYSYMMMLMNFLEMDDL